MVRLGMQKAGERGRGGGLEGTASLQAAPAGPAQTVSPAPAWSSAASSRPPEFSSCSGRKGPYLPLSAPFPGLSVVDALS